MAKIVDKFRLIYLIILYMAIAKIQSGDNVLVTAGNYKGTKGVVTKVHKLIKFKNGKSYIVKRAEVSNIAQIVKYRRAVTYNGKDYPGSQTFVNRKVDISNLSLLTTDQKVSKVFLKTENNKAQRFLKKDNSLVIREKLTTSKAKTNEIEALTNDNNKSK
jgi:large subunit ribosomal protein L24